MIPLPRLALVAALLPAIVSTASAVTLDLAPPTWERWNPPAEGNTFATYAVWNFDTDPGADLSVIPDNDAIIESNPMACMLCGNSATFPPTAVWRNTGAWEMALGGMVDISLTNVIDELPAKQVRAQVTWRGEASTPPTFYVVTAFDPSLPGSGIIPQAGGEIIDTDPFGTHTFDEASGSWHSLYLAEIRPNPNNENFELFVAPNTTIDGIVIDTISIPEAGCGALVVAGLLVLAAGRRRLS